MRRDSNPQGGGATQRGAAAGRRTRNPSVPYQQRTLRISTGTWGRSQSVGTKGTPPSTGSSTLKRQTPQARKDQERLTSRKYQPRSEKRAVIYKMARGPGGPGIKFVASSARKEGHLMWPSSCAGLPEQQTNTISPAQRPPLPKIFKKVVDARVTTRLIYPLRDGPVAQLVRASG